jgi:uncharacterized protein with GYD domain
VREGGQLVKTGARSITRRPLSTRTARSRTTPFDRQEETIMRVMYLASYAPQAMKGLLEGSDREAVMRATFESVGGRLTGLAFTRGDFDVVVTGEVPDQAASMAIAVATRASGSITKLSVLEQLEMPQIIAAAKKAAKAYKPAG